MTVLKVKCLVTTITKAPTMFDRKRVTVQADHKFLTRDEAQALQRKGHKVRVPEQRHREYVTIGDSVRPMSGAYYCAILFDDSLPVLPSDWP